MPTTKYRVNLSVPTDLKHALQTLAKRDDATVAAKTMELVRSAIEIEEDAALLGLAQQRQGVKGKFVSHNDAWV